MNTPMTTDALRVDDELSAGGSRPTAGPVPMSRRAGDLAQAYRFLERVIGVIALLLPVVVALGDYVIDGQGVRGSISSYYYGRTGGYFVGSLCALAVFFLSYDYRPRPWAGADNRLSNVACVTAIGVALFPTSSDGAAATDGSLWVARVHVSCAAVLFCSLAVFSLVHFTAEGDGRNSTRRSLRRAFSDPAGRRTTRAQRRCNRVHRWCGWTIVIAIGLIVLNNLSGWGAMFWLESVAVWAFGVSWLCRSLVPTDGWPVDATVGGDGDADALADTPTDRATDSRWVGG